MYDVVVVGGGASGLVAAISAAHAGSKVLVLEKKDRIGRKILATGNGKCNLGNVDLSINHFVSHDLCLVRTINELFDLESLYHFFCGLGLEIVVEEGRLYPRSKQAASVLDVLRHELDRQMVSIETEAPVRSLVADNGVYKILYGESSTVFSRTVILSTGGQAGPQLGCSGDGYELARDFGHSVISPAPALVGLKLQSPYLKALSGLRVDATVAIPELDLTETGEVIFTDYGISGIPIFDLTRHIGHRKRLTLRLRLAHDTHELTLQNFLEVRFRALSHKVAQDALIGYLPKQLVAPSLKEAGIPLERASGKVSPHQIAALAATLWQWDFIILGLNTWEQAQTTWGGVPLSEVSVPTLESKKQPGLYLAGELLDVHGRCGGYNLHWAFGSGFLAGQSAGKRTDSM